MKNFTLSVVALTVFLLGLIWLAGSGEAVQPPKTKTIFLADTVHINLDEVPAASDTASGDSRETIFREIKKFDQTVFDIKNRYMEDIDTRKLIDAGIRGMLEDLDRYSVLMEKQSYDQLMESTHGKYEGLGMEIDARNDHIIIVTPMEGSPAYKRGLKSGDIIYEIDGKSTYKMTTSDAAKLMRGTAGTKVTLKIKREGIPDLLDFDVERAVIELKSVSYYGVVPGTNIGYIRLSRFAEETSNELTQAVKDLNAKGVDGLIFDIRSNGGGLLQQAVETSELFIPEGKLVVYTRGKYADTERRYYSRRAPLYPDKPLVVLVDEGTASASEIVAGAIQDWDRGIIMGHPTYGKGLVQQIFPVGNDDDVALKLTTAKYYVPSGRCIQKPDKEKKVSLADMVAMNSDQDSTADSLKTDSLAIKNKEVYYTNKGRVVYGGGGILPDVETEQDRFLTPLEINLERKMLFFDYAVKYLASHPDIDRNVVVTDEMVKEFKDFMASKDFTYKTSLESSLDNIKKIVKDEKKDTIFDASIAQFEKKIENEKEADFANSLDYIRKAIKRELVAKLSGERGVYEEVILKSDPGVLQAVKLLGDKTEYTKILQSGQTRGEVPSE
ncbi:Peptidase, PDZ and S41 family [Candidatus Zixiibacteriota bacterium]|nr:Peptidase, PDZ and S41 family [candidate division Zixibacteria bacterium]